LIYNYQATAVTIFDLSGEKIKTDNLKNFTGKLTDDELNGKINGGGTQVTVNASSGKVSLTMK